MCINKEPFNNIISVYSTLYFYQPYQSKLTNYQSPHVSYVHYPSPSAKNVYTIIH